MSERVFTFPTYDLAQSILGQHNRYLQMMNEVIPADIVSRGDTVVIKGDELQVEALYRTLEELVFLYKEGSTITESQVRIAAKMVMNGKGDALHSMFEDTLSVTMRGKSITPKTEGQKQYVDSIRKNTITFGIGPAGTGKTFLAVALAAFYLKNRNVDKIILTRPAVEAGERVTSGLYEAEKVLKRVSGIHMVYFTDQDVVRHDLVGRIVKAYDAYHQKLSKEE